MATKALPGAKADDEQKKVPKTPTDETPPEDGEDEGGEGEADDEEEESADDSSLEGMTPEQVKAHIKKLRKENAKYRTKAKAANQELAGLRKDAEKFSAVKKVTDDEAEPTPEELVPQLTGAVNDGQVKLAILELVVEHEIPKSERKYFEFLVKEALNELPEEEELSEEAIEEIVTSVKARGASGSGSSVGGNKGKGGNPPPEKKGGGGDVTVEQYVSMTFAQKADLHSKNADLYGRLHKEAVSKNLLK